MVIVVLALFLPEKNVALFLALGVAIAIVLGGTQALSRSFFSLLIPRGREGEYFASTTPASGGRRGRGARCSALVFQLTGSYRPAIVALVVFFVLGGFFLLRLDPKRGIREAGNAPPRSSRPLGTPGPPRAGPARRLSGPERPDRPVCDFSRVPRVWRGRSG